MLVTAFISNQPIIGIHTVTCNKSTDSESLASKVCAFIIYSGFPYTVRTRKSQNKKVRRRAFPLCGALYIRSGPLTKELLLDLDQRGGLFGDLLVSLGQLQLQDAVLELGGNIGGLQVLAYIEAAGTALLFYN